MSSPIFVATTTSLATNLTTPTSVTRATTCTVITHYQRSVQLPSPDLYQTFSSNSSRHLIRDETTFKGAKRFNTLKEVAEDGGEGLGEDVPTGTTL